MDHFMEEVVVKRNRAMEDVTYILANILMVVSGLLAVLLLQPLFGSFSLFGLAAFLLSAGVAALLFFFKDRLRTEFEYTFTNGDLDFAQVFNNQKRKTLGTMRVKNVEAFGPVNSNEFRKLINMPGLTQKKWFLNRDGNLYYFYYQKDGARTVIVFEPSDELVGMIRKYLPANAYRA